MLKISLILVLFVFVNICYAQSPYNLSQTLPTNRSAIIAIWVSPTGNLVRMVTKKYQILTYEIVKGTYTITGIKQLNTNADEIQFSADGNLIYYRCCIQNDGSYFYKIYRIPQGIYYGINGDGSVIGSKVSKNMVWTVFWWRNGRFIIHSMNNVFALQPGQDFPFPQYNGVLQLSQYTLSFTQNTTLAQLTTFQPLPVFEKQISGMYWSQGGDVIMAVYNRDTFVVIYRWSAAKRHSFFQTLDHSTARIYAPLITPNCSKILIPTEGKIYEYDLENMESKSGQYVLNSITLIDIIPKTFLSSFDFNILLVANETDILVIEYNGKTYQQKWRVKFVTTIDAIAFNDGVHLLISLANKEGVYDLTSCIKTGKNCTTNSSNSSLPKVSGSGILRTQTEDKSREDPNKRGDFTLVILGLNVLVIILIISLLVFGVFIYLKFKREAPKSEISIPEEFVNTKEVQSVHQIEVLEDVTVDA